MANKPLVPTRNDEAPSLAPFGRPTRNSAAVCSWVIRGVRTNKMPKLLYCWRCKMDIPMLDEREWQQIGAPEGNLIQAMKDYQQQHGVSLAEAKQEAPKEILARYKDLTGFEETNVNALYHHRVELYGPPCLACGKPLRTPTARRCVECGAVRSKNIMEPTP